MPLSCSTDLAMPLSMQTADDSTPAPDVGQAQCLEVALDHAVLAEGPVQDGEDDGVGRHVVAEMRELGVRAAWPGARRATRALRPCRCRPARTAASTHCLAWVSPMSRTGQARSSAVCAMRRAEMHEISCSAEGPP